MDWSPQIRSWSTRPTHSKKTKWSARRPEADHNREALDPAAGFGCPDASCFVRLRGRTQLSSAHYSLGSDLEGTASVARRGAQRRIAQGPVVGHLWRHRAEPIRIAGHGCQPDHRNGA